MGVFEKFPKIPPALSRSSLQEGPAWARPDPKKGPGDARKKGKVRHLKSKVIVFGGAGVAKKDCYLTVISLLYA